MEEKFVETPPAKVPVKFWYKSKTLWFNLAAVAFVTVQAIVMFYFRQGLIDKADFDDLQIIGGVVEALISGQNLVEIEAAIIAGVNLILRYVTDEGVTFRKSEVVPKA